MGYKIASIVNPVPAWIKDGRLYSDYGALKDGIDIKINIDFPKQTLFTERENVAVFLKNGEYTLVVRYDDTVTVSKNGYVYTQFLIGDSISRDTMVNTIGYIKNAGNLYNLYMYDLNINERLIYSPMFPVSCILNKNEHKNVLDQINKGMLGIVQLNNDQNGFEFVDTRIPIEGKYFSQAGFTLLRGWVANES